MSKNNDLPKLEKIASGWAAYGNGWAVHAPTKQKALAKYQERKAFHDKLVALPPFRDRIHQEMVSNDQAK
jgi:hypothetical protein